MVLYTSNVPQPNQTVAASQPIINANFNYLQTWAQVDHYSSGDSTDTKNGYHQWVTFSDFTGAPGLGAGRGVLYADRDGSSNPILAYQNSLGSFALTGRNPSVAASGYTCLPGGVYLQWGFVTTSLNGTSGTQTFPFTFPNNCFFVTTTACFASGATPSSRATISVQHATAKASFNWRALSDSSNYKGFYWSAIGN